MYPESMATLSYAVVLKIWEAHVVEKGRPFFRTPVNMALKYPVDLECGLSGLSSGAQFQCPLWCYTGGFNESHT